MMADARRRAVLFSKASHVAVNGWAEFRGALNIQADRRPVKSEAPTELFLFGIPGESKYKQAKLMSHRGNYSYYSAISVNKHTHQALLLPIKV